MIHHEIYKVASDSFDWLIRQCVAIVINLFNNHLTHIAYQTQIIVTHIC